MRNAQETGDRPRYQPAAEADADTGCPNGQSSLPRGHLPPSPHARYQWWVDAPVGGHGL